MMISRLKTEVVLKFQTILLRSSFKQVLPILTTKRLKLARSIKKNKLDGIMTICIDVSVSVKGLSSSKN